MTKHIPFHTVLNNTVTLAPMSACRNCGRLSEQAAQPTIEGLPIRRGECRCCDPPELRSKA